MPFEERRVKPQGQVLQNFLFSKAAVQIIIGPLGSGKTIQVCDKIIALMCQQEPNEHGIRLSRWVGCRNTYSELFSTTVKDFLEINGDLGTFNQGAKAPPTHYLDFDLPDGTRVKSEMIFISFDRPDHVKKARGLQLTGVWLNEVKELSKPVVDMLDMRHGRFPSKKEGVEPTWHGMLADCNAPDEDHWLYNLAEENRPDGWEFFKQPGGLMRQDDKWVLNPLAENTGNLPHDYYMRGKGGKSDAWIKVNFANEYGFVSEGKPVHPRYVDSIHCKDFENWQPSRNRKIVLGFDFGRTPACVLVQETTFGGWICFDEFVSENMSAITFAPELSRYLQKTYPGHEFAGHGDPSGGDGNQATDDTPIKILRSTGIPCKPTHSNDPLIRRSAVEIPLCENDMSGQPRLIILPKAATVRKGLMGGFCYKRIQVAGDERYHDKPDKNKLSHPVEALEYALQGEGEGKSILKHHSKEGYADWGVAINA